MYGNGSALGHRLRQKMNAFVYPSCSFPLPLLLPHRIIINLLFNLSFIYLLFI